MKTVVAATTQQGWIWRHRIFLLAGVTAILFVTATMLSACGGSGGNGASRTPSGQESAADFVRRITVEFSRGQSGRLWDELLPADQHVVTRARFVECQQNEGWNLKSIKVLETYDDPVYVSGKPLPAKAVSVRVVSEDGVTTATMHAVSVKGVWRWVLQPVDRGKYKKGNCPSTG